MAISLSFHRITYSPPPLGALREPASRYLYQAFRWEAFCRLRSELNVLDSRNLDWFIAYMCFILWSSYFMHLWNLLFIYGAQVVQGIPGPHKSMCEWCTYLGGKVLQLDPLRLILVFELLNVVSKVHWKGKVDLDHERLPLHSDERVINSKFISLLLLPFCS